MLPLWKLIKYIFPFRPNVNFLNIGVKKFRIIEHMFPIWIKQFFYFLLLLYVIWFISICWCHYFRSRGSLWFTIESRCNLMKEETRVPKIHELDRFNPWTCGLSVPQLDYTFVHENNQNPYDPTPWPRFNTTTLYSIHLWGLIFVNPWSPCWWKIYNSRRFDLSNKHSDCFHVVGVVYRS